MIYYFVVPAAVALAAYLVGSVNFSILLSRLLLGGDIREQGSGNAGATNMLRTHGKKMGVLVLVLDILKGIAAVLLAKLLSEYMIAFTQSMSIIHGGRWDGYSAFFEKISLPYIAGVCVVLGHNFPVYFGFKGGKGVATSLGVVLTLDPKVGLIVLAVAVLIMALTRYVSLGSIVGGALFIVLTAVEMIAAHSFDTVPFVCSLILGGLLIARHHANIKRLINGTENKLGAKKEVG